MLMAFCAPRVLLVAVLLVLAVPCVALFFTENKPLPARLCGIVLPVLFYWMMLTLSRNVGRMVWLMFFFIFLSAFQIVLLYLFGQGPIAVDMFLNILTTNPGEVSELLGNLLPAIATVVLLYIPPLVAATVAVRNKLRLPGSYVKCRRPMAAGCFLAGMALTICTAMCVPRFSMAKDIFPLNACYNLVLAVQRAYATAHYDDTSAAFNFGTSSEHDADKREIYVLVIGETARADNFALCGYSRNTTPLLAKESGLTVFKTALSQSNTTHKSVPMLLSAVSAENYDSIYYHKSIITAFREAGFYTVFLSNQKRNHSFIDFFGAEADCCMFVSDSISGDITAQDDVLADYAKKDIDGSRRKIFIVLHTYGSHFTYNERYTKDGSYFRPDTDMSALRDNRASLINAYDNTIRHTDRMLARLIGMLKDSGAEAAMLYTSDHGEDIFDDGSSFLHASPVPSYFQLHVPLLIWTSDAYRAAYPDAARALRTNSVKPVATSLSVFHSMLDIAGLSTPYRRDSLSVASLHFAPAPPLYLNDHNEAERLEDTGMTDADMRMFEKIGSWPR